MKPLFKSSTRLTGLAITVLTSLALGNSGHAKNVDPKHLDGELLLTTDDHHFVVRTDKYFFRINRAKLDADLQRRLEQAAFAHAKARFDTPDDSIELRWPTVLPTGKSSLKALEREVPDMVQIFGDKIAVKGKLALSFNDEHFLVQSDGKLYRLDRKSLSADVNQSLAKASIGDKVNLTVDLASAQHVGTLIDSSIKADEPSARMPASVAQADRTQEDAITYGKGMLRIVGTLVHSFNTPLVIIQVKDTYLQLKRDGLIFTDGTKSADIEKPGRHVNVQAPLHAVDFIWRYEPQSQEPR